MLVASYRSRRSNSQRAERGTLTGEAKEISLAGGRFFVVGELWVSGSVLDIPRPQGVDPLSASRYENAASESQAVIAELYQDLPPHLQEALANENRQAGFKKHVSFASLHTFFESCLINLIVSQATKPGPFECSTWGTHK